jgi:hypothetical protein
MVLDEEGAPQEWDSGAEVPDDDPVVLSPLRDDAAVTVSLHKGG